MGPFLGFRVSPEERPCATRRIPFVAERRPPGDERWPARDGRQPPPLLELDELEELELLLELELDELELLELLELELDELELLEELELELLLLELLELELDELELLELDELDELEELDEFDESDELELDELDPWSPVASSLQPVSPPKPRIAAPESSSSISRRVGTRGVSGPVGLSSLIPSSFIRHADAATRADRPLVENGAGPPSPRYHSMRRITSSAVIMSMQRGRSPTTSTQS